MVECHAGLEIAPYISSAMQRRRETLFSTSQKPRTDNATGTGRWRWREAVTEKGRQTRHRRRRPSLDFLIRTKLDVHMYTLQLPLSSSQSSLWAFCLFFFSSRAFFLSFLLSTSDQPRAPLVRATFSRWLLYTFRSRVSFSLGSPDYERLKIGTLAEKKRIEKSSLTEKKKRKKE